MYFGSLLYFVYSISLWFIRLLDFDLSFSGCSMLLIVFVADFVRVLSFMNSI